MFAAAGAWIIGKGLKYVLSGLVIAAIIGGLAWKWNDFKENLIEQGRIEGRAEIQAAWDQAKRLDRMTAHLDEKLINQDVKVTVSDFVKQQKFNRDKRVPITEKINESLAANPVPDSCHGDDGLLRQINANRVRSSPDSPDPGRTGPSLSGPSAPS